MSAAFDIAADVNETMQFYVSWIVNSQNKIVPTMQGTFELRALAGDYVPIILNNIDNNNVVLVSTQFLVTVTAQQLQSLGSGNFYYNFTVLDTANYTSVTLIEGNFFVTGVPRS